MANNTFAGSVAPSGAQLNDRMRVAVEETRSALPNVSALGNRQRLYHALDRADYERMAIFGLSFDVLRVMEAHAGADRALDVALRFPFAWEAALRAALPLPLPTLGEVALAEAEAQSAADPLQLAAALHPDERTCRRALSKSLSHIQALRTQAFVLDRHIHAPRALAVR